MPVQYEDAVKHTEYVAYYMRKFPTYISKRITTRIANLVSSLIAYKIYKPNLFIMPYLELCITPLCTLSCKKCANFMYMYSRTSHYAVDAILQPLDKLMSSIDFAHRFRILGGEPFLHPNLCDIISHCNDIKKIDRIEVVTNGTIVPHKKLLKTLQKTNSIISISNYGDLSCNKFSLMSELKNYNIPYVYHDRLLMWQDMGDGRRFEHSYQQVLDLYKACTITCKTLVQGELHVCPRSAHGTALGFIPKKTEEYVDVMKTDALILRDMMRRLYDIECIEACYYCRAPFEPKLRTTPAGKQIASDESGGKRVT